MLSESYSGGGFNPNAEFNRNYVYGLELISQKRAFLASGSNSTQTSYYVYDGHGSVRSLADPTGAATDSYDYDAFVNLIHSTGATPNNYLFASEQYDTGLHLYYNRSRYLNTSTDRFLTTDSLEGHAESPISLNSYLYASDDATDNLDPSGHDDLATEIGAFSVSDTLNNVTSIQPLKGFPKPRDAHRLSNHGAAFIASWEQLSNILYNDQGKKCTIGVGHLVHDGPCNGSEDSQFLNGLSDAQALALFASDLARFQFEVIVDVRVPLSHGEFDSLVSLSYNIGPGAFRSSRLLKYLNQNSYFLAAGHFIDFRFVTDPATGKKQESKGLINRRLAERLMFDFETYIHNDSPIQFDGYGLFF